jgi:pilus assembly protein Flp/PilA
LELFHPDRSGGSGSLSGVKVMRQFSRKVAGWFSLTSERGVTAIEYGLIAALIAVVIIAGLTLIGTNLQSIFAYIAGKITTPS